MSITYATDREREQSRVLRSLLDARNELADRVDTLEAAINAALHGTDYAVPTAGDSVTLAEQLLRMAEDAARYRWLRYGDNDEHVLRFAGYSRCGTDDAWVLRTTELDAAIDAAMGKLPAAPKD